MMNFSDPFLGNGTKASKPLVALAEDILHYAHIVSDYFDEHHLPQPSFELDGPEDYSNDLPDEIHEARAKLRGAAADMGVLAAGPKANLMWMVWNYHDVSTLNYVQHFRVAEAVPLIGSVRIEEIAKVTSTPVGRLKRILRYLMLQHVFAEPQPGYIAHTPASRQLVTSDHVRSWVGVRTEETGPAAFGLVAAAERWGPDAQELEQTPYSHVHSDGKLSRFGLLALPEHKDREVRFGKLMRALQSTEAYDLRHTATGYAWQDLGENALVVDVGGNTGATAQALVRHHPNLRVVVQDLPGVIAHGRKILPAEMADRITFMEYNFMEQAQPVPNATAYVFRQIFHDWPDKYGTQALRNTAKIMQRGQKLIIVDVVMPPPGSTLHQIESQLRRSDLEMMVQFNALEREAADWELFVKQAHPRLELESFSKPPGSANSIIVIVVGREGLTQQANVHESLTYGRRDSLIYADTKNFGPSRKDSKTFATAFPAP